MQLVGLPLLEHRRIHLKLCLLYKIDLCHFPTRIFTPRQIPHNFRMNSFQLYHLFAWTNAIQFSFVPHTFPYGTHFTLNRLLVHILSLSFTVDLMYVFVLVVLLVVVSLYGSHSLVGMHLISFILLLCTQCYYVQTFIEKKETVISVSVNKCLSINHKHIHRHFAFPYLLQVLVYNGA